MSTISRWLRRLRLLARRDEVERTMDAEIRHHLECEIADRIGHGMDPADARRSALAAFGGVESIKEQGRDARGGRTLEDVAVDVRYGVRVLRRNPGHAAAAILTFALGVAVLISIFSLVYGIVLRPLPYSAPDRLVVVWERNVPRDRDRNVVSLENFEAWRERARSFSSMAAIVPTSITLPGDPAPERLIGAEVTPGYFSTLGVRPALGRSFTAADGRDGLAVILSDELWRRRFAADAAVLGRAVIMSGRPYTVVGIMPHGFAPPELGWLGGQDLWFPFVATPQARSWGRFLIVIARLADGVAPDAARAEMAGVAAQRARESADNDGWSASVAPLAGEIIGETSTPLLVLLGGATLLLLMAVSNVTTLTLSLVARRRQELAVRRAIGATDRRIFRQLFTQSAVVGLGGSALGALVAIPGVRLLVEWLPPDVPRPESVALDAPVLIMTMGVALAATAIFGTVAGWRGRRAGAASALTAEAGMGRSTARSGGFALVTIEIALAGVLAVMAVLTVRSFARLSAVDFGFTPGGVVTARVALPGSYATPDSQRVFFDRVIDRIRSLPTVTAAGVTFGPPLSGIGPATVVRDAARAADPAGRDPVADVRLADRGTLAALGIQLQSGGGFEEPAADGPVQVMMSATLARTLWPDRDPIGRQLALEIYGGISARVVGVFRDVRLFDARTAPRALVFLPAARFPDSMRDIVVRVAGDPAAIVPSLRNALVDADRSLPLFRVRDLSVLVRQSTARERLTAWLLAIFAGAAVALAGIGIFGVFAGDVAARRKEIGIRLALGAGESRILVHAIARAGRGVLTGLALGAAMALGAGRAMEAMLFGIRPFDPLSFALAALLVTALSLVATILPVWLALRQVPLATLREG